MCQQSVLCEFLSTELESEYQWCGSFSTCQAVMSVPITVKVVVLIPAYMYVSFSTCQAVMSVSITVKVVVLIPAYMYVSFSTCQAVCSYHC